MREFDEFPIDNRAVLTSDQVATELTRHYERGYRVTRSTDGRHLVITLDEANEIQISTKGFQVQGFHLSNILCFEDPRDLGEFRQMVDAVAGRLIGSRWGHRTDPTRSSRCLDSTRGYSSTRSPANFASRSRKLIADSFCSAPAGR